MFMAGKCPWRANVHGGQKSIGGQMCMAGKSPWGANVHGGQKSPGRHLSLGGKSRIAKVTGGHFDTGGKIPAANVGGQKVKRQKAGGQMSLNLLNIQLKIQISAVRQQKNKLLESEQNRPSQLLMTSQLQN